MRTYDEVMEAAAAASRTGTDRFIRASIIEISDFLFAHAPKLNDTGDTGDLSEGQVKSLGDAFDNLQKGITVQYQSPWGAALQPDKILKDVGDSAGDALKQATEGATKGIGSTVVKVGAIAIGLGIVWSIIQSQLNRRAS